MWVFLTSRIRQWIILAIAIPLATAVVRRIRTAIEKRKGETPLTRGLGKVEDLADRRGRSERRQA
jgi:Mg-chelatase subunit ChlD